ncbi:MAG: SulP family inorganic anion transporter [Candidatus Sericytochromatia bacterium]|nr:SulP family inorganic anion transporter [Candidatus Sericytochromatia bacterium]
MSERCFWLEADAPFTQTHSHPLAILLIGTLAGWLLGLRQPGSHVFAGQAYITGPEYLLRLPDSLLQGLVLPDFGRWQHGVFWKLVLTLTLIASLESLMSALAVDKLDPLERKANLQKDLQAVGLGSTVSGLLGGLPLITEIVRSSANVAQGGRSRWANFFHGAVMLLFLVFLPTWLEQIPLVALAALLIYTGFQLAAPTHFYHVYRIGPEQYLVFMVTLLATLATDLLIGMACGMVCNAVIHRWLGVHWQNMFTLHYHSEETDSTRTLQVLGPVVFSNLLPLKQALNEVQTKKQIIDLSQASLLDHTTMAYLEQLQHPYSVQGLEFFQPLSSHPLATRRRRQSADD